MWESRRFSLASSRNNTASYRAPSSSSIVYWALYYVLRVITIVSHPTGITTVMAYRLTGPGSCDSVTTSGGKHVTDVTPLCSSDTFAVDTHNTKGVYYVSPATFSQVYVHMITFMVIPSLLFDISIYARVLKRDALR
jgi:hypothetical protein